MIRNAGSDATPGDDIDHIFKNAFGVPLELSSAPTTNGGELPKNGDAGWFSGSLYVNLGGTVRRITFTDV